MANKNVVAICTGDLHFSIPTLELATSAFRQGLELAAKLNVPFLVNGDLLDGKSLIRGECANRLITLLTENKRMSGIVPKPGVIINRGNHDALSEKAEAHSLNFLKPYCQVVDTPTWVDELDGFVIPYFSNGAKLQEYLDTLPDGSRIFAHQGVLGGDKGAYIKDDSAMPKEAFANFRTILSHYHRRDDIKCGRPRKGAVGLASYLGSAYSVTYAESGDGEKGLNILYDNGILELVPTNLRKHVKVTRNASTVFDPIRGLNPGDLLWLLVEGTHTELAAISKKAVMEAFPGCGQLRFDKVATEVEGLEGTGGGIEKLTDLDLIDKLIDGGADEAAAKAELKAMARELLG